MLSKNNKPMFFVLLTPLYLLLLTCLIGMSMGSIEWLDSAFTALVIILAAWGLSRENGIFIHIIGLLLFIGLGVQLIYPTLIQPEHIGPWTINIYVGVALVLWGLIAFVYDIVRLNSKREN